MTAAVLVQASPVRRLNPRQDLAQVADLVEICFASHMDDDGRMYVRQMRRVANEARYLGITSIRVEGFVWEQDGKVIGNITMIPFQAQGKLVYLAANIATHPDFRRQGIGRKLTEAGMQYATDRGAAACWLQVRDDNYGAVRLYQSLGFQERARRTTWIWQPGDPYPGSLPGIEISRRLPRDWSKQADWLLQLYPDNVRWNLPFDIHRFQPGVIGSLSRLLHGEPQQHWAARQDNRLIGTVSWEPTRLSADNLWLAASEGNEETAIRALLPHVLRSVQPGRSLSINYPSGRATQTFFLSGFRPHNTLIWMDFRYH